MKVTADAARRFLVARHFLAPARSLAGPGGVLEVLRRLGSIQFDPIAVAGRNHDLMLHARVAGYQPAWCDVLYERCEIFETTNKALSLVPMSDMPWFRQGFGRKGPRFHAAILADNAPVAQRVLGRIEPRIGNAAVHVLNLWWENGFDPDRADRFVAAMRDALEAYLRFAGADRVDWAAHLAAERRLFGGRA